MYFSISTLFTLLLATIILLPLPAVSLESDRQPTELEQAVALERSEQLLQQSDERREKNVKRFSEQFTSSETAKGNSQFQPKPIEPLTPQEQMFFDDLTRIDSSWTPAKFRKTIHHFGYDFFDSITSDSPPTASLPVGSDYRLGPGDGLIIHVWNNTIDEVFPVEVNNAGRLIIPKAGEIMATGFSLPSLEKQLATRFSRIYSNPEISVSLAKVRAINVFVIGEVNKPGSYTLSTLSTLLNGLVKAGGPTLRGTLRKIQLKRRGEKTIHVDLYDFFMQGDREFDVPLKDGDTIFVPVIGRTVMVYGNVRRSGIYELKNTPKLQEILTMAGNLSASGFNQLIRLMRTSQKTRRTMTDIARDKWNQTKVQDGDFIHVTEIYNKIENNVEIKGNVERPGNYQFIPGMKVRDLLSHGIRLLPDTYTKRADLIRQLGDTTSYEYSQKDLKRLVNTTIIPIDLNKLLSDKSGQENVLLKPLDQLIIYHRRDFSPDPMVTIGGAIRRGGKYPLLGGMTVRDLIYQAGNVTPHALLDRLEIMRRIFVGNDKQKYREDLITLDLKKILAAKSSDEKENIRLENFDVVTVLSTNEKILQKKIQLNGEVLHPGEYLIREGETLSSLIRRAGGYTEKSFLPGAIFTRISVQRRQKEGLKQQVQELQKKVAEVQAEVALQSEDKISAEEMKAIKVQEERVAEISSLTPTGRINIELLPLKQLTGSRYDIALENGDQLYVPKQPLEITVIGEALNPGSVLYEEGQNIEYYINQLGGYSRYADKRRAYVVRADGTTISRMSFGQSRSRIHLRYETDLTRKISAGSFSRMKILRGDVIHIPNRIITHKTTTQETIDMIYKITLSFAGMKAAFK